MNDTEAMSGCVMLPARVVAAKLQLLSIIYKNSIKQYDKWSVIH